MVFVIMFTMLTAFFVIIYYFCIFILSLLILFSLPTSVNMHLLLLVTFEFLCAYLEVEKCK